MMKKIKFIGLLCLVLWFGDQLHAQSSDLEKLISKGVVEYDLGNYSDALRYFKQAYLLNKNSKIACYQMSLAYLALDKNEEAVIFSGKLMNEENDYRKDAYLVNASAWDNLGREVRARKMFEEGLKLYPSSYLLHYNLALNLYDAKDYEGAMAHAMSAIELKPAHSSSHLLLSYIMYDKGERIQSMLSLYYFLFIEPDTDRSDSAYDFLQRLWKQGPLVKGQKDIRLAKAGFVYNDFAKVELALSEVKDSLEVGDPLAKFVENTKVLFRILKKSSIDKDSFWGEFYIKLFNRLQDDGLTESFGYFVSNRKYSEEVKKWGARHSADFQRFIDWVKLM